MKKQKLTLRKETIRSLQVEMLNGVAGGTGVDCRVVGSGYCNSTASIIIQRCGIVLITNACPLPSFACGGGSGGTAD